MPALGSIAVAARRARDTAFYYCTSFWFGCKIPKTLNPKPFESYLGCRALLLRAGDAGMFLSSGSKSRGMRVDPYNGVLCLYGWLSKSWALFGYPKY